MEAEVNSCMHVKSPIQRKETFVSSSVASKVMKDDDQKVFAIPKTPWLMHVDFTWQGSPFKLQQAGLECKKFPRKPSLSQPPSQGLIEDSI